MDIRVTSWRDPSNDIKRLTDILFILPPVITTALHSLIKRASEDETPMELSDIIKAPARITN